MPRLENWWVFNDLLVGNVYDDERFPEGQIVTTSKVVKLDKDSGEARTVNTNYKLGKQRDWTIMVNEVTK